MREELEKYVNDLFAGNPEAEEIRQEILLNTLDRYDDLIAQGKNPQAAYSLAIAGIGDVSGLLHQAPAQEKGGPIRQRKKPDSVMLWILGTLCYLGISLITQAWFITWLIFPITGAVSGLIHAAFDLKEAKKHEK